MNELAIFKSPEFGQLEVVMIDGKEHFAATECARILGYAGPENAIKAHCRSVIKLMTTTSGGQKPKNYIPEGDVYRLITRAASQSKSSEIKEKAERFEHWIFDEILPAISKTGTYTAPTATPAEGPVLDTAPTDAKTMHAEAILMNARTRQASLMVRMAADKRLSANLVEILTVEAAQVCTGRRIPDGFLSRQPRAEQMALPEPPPELPPLPVASPEKPAPADPERYYTASEIAGAAGVRPGAVGTTANKHGLKTPYYGRFKRIYNRFSGGEVDCFFYNERGRERLLELLGNTKKGA